MKKKLLTTGLIAGAAAVAGALFYKYTREQIIFSCDRWDIDINKRFRMADNLIKSGALMDLTRDEVLSMLGVNGLKSNTKEAMEYFLNEDEENPKLLIIEFGEDEKVVNVTACV